MKEKKKIIIGGEMVQGVGYRLFLTDLAERLLLSSFDAMNIKKDGKQEVEVLVSGDKEKVEKFVSLAKENFPKNAKVDNISVQDYDEEIRTIESFSRSFSTSQLFKIANAGVSMLGKQDSMLDKQGQMLGKQDQMLNKQDKTIEIIEKGNSKLSNKLDVIHTDLSVNLKSFHQDTNQRFDLLEVKYGEISKNLVRAVEGIEKMLEKSEKDRQDFRDAIKELAEAIRNRK